MKYILATFLFLISLRNNAQEIKPFTFGPLVSMTSTTLNATPEFQNQISGSGYNIGGFGRFKVLFLYAQIDASFGTKSSSVTFDTSNATFNLNGLDVTAMMGVKLFGLGDLGNVRVFVGYSWNNFSDITYSRDGNEVAASNVNTNNHSILGGIGIDLSRLTFDVRYINGMSDLTVSSLNDVQLKVVSLTVGFKIL